MIHVTEQAFRNDGPPPAVSQLKTRRDIPAIIFRKPTDGGLPDRLIIDRKIRSAVRAGTYRNGDGNLIGRQMFGLGCIRRDSVSDCPALDEYPEIVGSR